jgi:hypothetical protein
MAMLMTAVSLLAFPALVHGHAYIFYPPLRGGAVGSEANGYCPQCMGTSSLPMTTCGKDIFLDFTHGPVTNFIAGQIVQFDVRVTAHHKGHFQFRLCDETMSSALGDFDAQEGCLNEHILERVRPEEIHPDCIPNDPREDCQPFDEANPGYWYLPPPAQTGSVTGYKIHYRIPEGLSCDKCTLQWWYLTANSCTPHPDAYNCYFGSSGEMHRLGWDVSKWCSGACSFAGTCPAVQGSAASCGEQFKNCADVKIVQSGELESGSSNAQPDTESEPASSGESSTIQPEPESEPASSTESSTAQPEPESESEPESEPASGEESSNSEPDPTSVPSSVECTKTPGLDRGVTDADCRTCMQGYQFWPCNEPILCQGCTGLVQMHGARKSPIRDHHFLGLIQTHDEVQKASWQADIGTGAPDLEVGPGILKDEL